MITIRIAEPGEQAALQALQRRASHSPPDADELPLEQIAAGYVYVAVQDSVVVGFSSVLPREDGDIDLDGLFVEPGRWRRRIGTSLVRDTIRRATLREGRWLHVIANPAAEAFYLACGFAFDGETQTRFGVARTMRKPLT